MAKIDLKFIKGDKKLAKDMGSTYTKKKETAGKKNTKKK